VAGAAVLGRLTWQLAEVTGLVPETARAKTIVLRASEWDGHRAGQHLDVRLTAEDGYQAERSYSIASAPGDPPAITVERLEDGEVSPYFVDELRIGDRFEIRGPIGGYFVWDADDVSRSPLLLVAGGSGIVPLMSIIRHRSATGVDVPARLLYSSRRLDDVIYRMELDQLADGGLELFHTLTRERPEGWGGFTRRVDEKLLGEVAWPADAGARVFVCGSTGFVEAAANGLVELGYPPETIRTERFGATGG
jgi:ferredoxin-NADP reductase